VVGEPPEPPRRRVPGTPAALEAVCLKALAKRPEDRYASALELAAEVRRWLADEPVSALPEPWTRRAARWLRRHRTAATAGLAILLTLAVSLGVATALLAAAGTREREAREHAEQERQEAERQREAALAESLRAAEATASAERRLGLSLAMLDRVALRNILSTQTRTLNEAERLAKVIDERPGKKPTPEEERLLLALAGTEVELTRQVDAVIRVLESEGGAFPEVFLSCRQDLIQVARRLRKGEVDEFALTLLKDLKWTFEQMATALRKARTQFPDRPQEARDSYSDACLWALTAEAVRNDPRVAAEERARLFEERAANAVKALRFAVEKGFADIEQIKRDTALEVLRDRDDFKQLLSEMQKAGQPK